MNKSQLSAAKRLLDQNHITTADYAKVEAYHGLKLFSLHHELQAALYFGVLLFTSGAGVLIYSNIDSIGHLAVLGALLALCVGLYVFCFKKAPPFSRLETDFAHPAYNFLVLTALLLGISFTGYVQAQYAPFGLWVEIPTLISALLALGTAYYFDNRNALSVGVTALAAAVGLTATPKAMLSMGFFDHQTLHYYAVGLGAVLLLWARYTQKNALKPHFELVFVTFGQHLFALGCLAGLFFELWPVMAVLLAALSVYLYRESHARNWTVVFAFTLIYAYLGLNIVLGKLISYVVWDEIFAALMLLAPPYFIGSIVLFVTTVKKFRKRHDRLS